MGLRPAGDSPDESAVNQSRLPCDAATRVGSSAVECVGRHAGCPRLPCFPWLAWVRRRAHAGGVRPFEVVIAGGGVGPLETALALNALAADRVQLTLIAPGDAFTYQPLAVVEPFVHRAPRQLGLAAIAADAGAGFVRDAIAAVDCDRRILYTEA